jgi:hypothetical protein
MLLSDVNLDEFGADALARNLEDLDWLERAARAHHEVIDAAARLFPVLPMRLATVYSGEDAMAETVRAHDAEFRAALSHVRGRLEWGVKAYAQPERDRGATAAEEASSRGSATQTRATQTRATQTRATQTRATRAEAGSRQGQSGSGLAYLSRRRDELAARKASERDAVASARSVHADLAGRSAGARLHAPQSPQLSGARTPMVLNASYLVGERDGPAFTEAVTTATAAYPDLRIELTGPWPPYSFAGVADTSTPGNTGTSGNIGTLGNTGTPPDTSTPKDTG